MTKKWFNRTAFVLAFSTLLACGQAKVNQGETIPIKGSWFVEMDLKEVSLPFEVEFIGGADALQMNIYNAEEVIEVKNIQQRNDSIIIQMPVFESAFYLKQTSADKLEGVWVNYYKSDDYIIPVSARRTPLQRFEDIPAGKETATLFPKYEVTFSPGKEEEYKAIGLFNYTDRRVSGTFATETGDYRYLEGAVIGDSLFLSTFDGSHAFYFSAQIKDSSLAGVFYSGTHFQEEWIATVNPDFRLRDPDSLTFLTDSSEVSFSLESVEGKTVALSDTSFEGKVKIIQIMGSWCPNCLDESKYFIELHNRYQSKGLEIIGVAFERTKSKESALKNLNRLKENNSISYNLLLGGFNRDQSPQQIFPMLDKIMSYPTTLYLDKDNKVRKVHTGFYGPGTGKYYEEYKEETESFVEMLLNED